MSDSTDADSGKAEETESVNSANDVKEEHHTGIACGYSVIPQLVAEATKAVEAPMVIHWTMCVDVLLPKTWCLFLHHTA